MPLNWKSISSDHVREACERLAAMRSHKPATGIVVWHKEQTLPAKELLRIAYRIANGLPENAELRFSSGDATLRLLNHLGFKVERLGSTRTRSGRGPEETTP